MTERNRRKPREKRRNLNVEEMESMGFADLAHNSNEDGWAYPDDDDEETTENHVVSFKGDE